MARLITPGPAGRFQSATYSKVRRLVTNISGLEKTGKDHVAFTAPDPLYVLDFDHNLEGVMAKFGGKKDIRVTSYDYITENDSQDAGLAVWRQFESDYARGLADAASVIVDTGTQMWAVARMAHFGRLTQVRSREYGPVNTNIMELVRMGKESSKNVLFLHRIKPVYVNNERTSAYEIAGFGDMPYEVHINLRTSRDEYGIFHVEIQNCVQNMRLFGEDLEVDEDMPTFEVILDMVYG